MRAFRNSLLFGYCLILTASVFADPLPCKAPGKERWPIKITLPANPTQKTMRLAQALAIPRLPDVKKNDQRYETKRITDQPVKENEMVTISGWLYLVAFESDDCDFHIQISPQPRTTTSKPTKDDDCIIVEVPSGTYATTLDGKTEAVRDWVVAKLLNNKPPTIGSVHVMVHPVYVKVTGALFYDDAHVYMQDGGTGRGKKGMESKTLWELHPVTSMAFAPKPKGT